MHRALALGCAMLVVASLATVPLPTRAHGYEVHADPQLSVNGTVVSETVFVVTDAWLALYRDVTNGTPSGRLAVTRVRAGSGLRRDVAVRIPEEQWASFGPNETIHLVLHRDDGDGEFEPRDDDNVLSSFGSPVTTAFVLRRADRQALVTAARFAPQEPDDGAVTVRRATLPADGHLVLRTVTDDGAGPVVGHAALDAGTHRNVSAPLNRSVSVRGEGSSLSLEAVLYRDGDGDGAFDADDDPVRAGESVVGTTFRVNRSGVVTPTHREGTVTSAHHHEGTATPTKHHEGPATSTHRTTAPGATPTDSDEPTETRSETGTGTDAAGPGFGVAVGLLAALVGLLALGRRGRR